MHHRITYMYINFQQTWVDQSKPCAQIYLPKNCKLHKFATILIILFQKSITSDMHPHKTYMYINFQQNRICRSVITVHPNVLAKKIASFINLQLPIEDFKNRLIQTCVIVKRTRISIFSKIKAVHTNLFAKKRKLHKFTTCN